MFYCYTPEQRAEKVKETAEAYRVGASLFPALRKVAESFDGKVLNCRFENALSEAAGRRIIVKKYSTRLEIYEYDQTYSGCTAIYLASLPLDQMPDGKRIPAALLIESARTYRESNLKRAADLEAAQEKAEETAMRVKYFVEQANRLLGAMPSEIKDIYNLVHRVYSR